MMILNSGFLFGPPCMFKLELNAAPYSHLTSALSAGSIFSIGGIMPCSSTRVAAAAFSPVFSSYIFTAVWRSQPTSVQTVQQHCLVWNSRYAGHVTIYFVECSLLRSV